MNTDRLDERRSARDLQIQQEIDNPDTTESRRQQLLRLQRRRIREGRASSSTMNTLSIYSSRPQNFLLSRTSAAPIREEPPNTPRRPGIYSSRSNGIEDLSALLNRAALQSLDDEVFDDSVYSPASPDTPVVSSEEDSDVYDALSAGESSLSDEFISDSDSDDSCSSISDVLEQDWMKKNCSVCKSMVTMENFEEKDLPDLVSVKVYSTDSFKFGKGHCILKSDLEGMLRSDIGSESPKYIFSLYKMRTGASSEGSLAGYGSVPSNQFVVQLNIDTLSTYVTLGSIHKLLHTSEKVLYAAPLYGGKRRRIGNVAGRMTIVGANHGQIPGFRIYKLFTRNEIEAGVEVSAGENDFIMPMNICKKVEELLDVFSDTTRIRQIVMDEIIEYILKV